MDCGGPCSLLCPAQYAPLNVLWTRFIKVNDGVYNVLAYIENPNINAEADNLSYIFKLYDARGILLKERTGTTFVSPDHIVAVFEAGLNTGNSVPVRAEFFFTSPAVWIKSASQELGLSVSQAVISREDTAPRLSAILLNNTVKILKNIEAVAVVYNSEGNTIAFSRTIIDSLPGKTSREINFNWPKPFTLVEQPEISARTEIILKVLK